MDRDRRGRNDNCTPLEETQLGEKSDDGTIGEKLPRMWTEENMKPQIYRVKTVGTNTLKEEQGVKL